MRYFKHFQEALDHFRDWGGGMNYDQFTRLWSVGDFVEIVELSECSPREQTEYALLEGGFTGDMIREELADWED